MQSSTIITINQSGIIQSVDKNCCKLFGYDLEELVGRPVKTIIPPPYKEQHDTYLANYKRTKVPKIIGKSRVVEGQHKDGSIFPIRLSVSKVGEGEGVVFIGMIDKMEDRSASITINSSGQIVSCNQNVEEVFGYKPNQIIGSNISMLMPAPHSEKHDNYIKTYLAGGPPKVVGKVRNVAGKHRNGTVFPISLQVEQLKIGNIHLFRGKVEKVDTMENVFTFSKTGEILSCNQNFVQALCGYTSKEIIGKHISTLLPTIHQTTDPHSQDGERVVTFRHPKQEDKEPASKKAKIASSEVQEDCSWRTPGVHHKLLRHRDGSLFSVSIEIYAFQEKGEELFAGKVQRDIDKEGLSEESGKFIGPYCVTKTIGQGSYGKVKMAYHRETQQKVAIKMLYKAGMKEPELERARRETEILRQLDHPHIARLYDVIETETAMNIVMEYAGNTLLSYVLERGGFGEDEARTFFEQILSAVFYCHERNIIHRDIKHQNLLLDSEYKIKLIDFGLSNFMEKGKLRSTFCGTPAYASPEMILGNKYTGPEVDVWSLGVVLYSMITGVFPFDSVGDIIKGDFANPSHASEECKHLLRRMLVVDVKQRASVVEISEHPWMKKESFETVACPISTDSSSATFTETEGTSKDGVKVIECTVVSTEASPHEQ